MDYLIDSALHTGLNALQGLLLALVSVLLLGVVVTLFPAVRAPVYVMGIFTKVSPAVAYAPLFVSAIGANSTVKVLTAAMICFYPLLVELLEAFQRFPARLNEQADLRSASTLERVQLYGWAYILEGMTRALLTAAPLAVVGSIVADYVVGGTRPGGLGQAILAASTTSNTQQLIGSIAASTALGLLGFGLSWLIHRQISKVLNLGRG